MHLAGLDERDAELFAARRPTTILGTIVIPG